MSTRYMSCSLDHSKVALDVATAGACLAAATAVLLGGLDAAGCPNRT